MSRRKNNPGDVLTDRALNRALLARQCLHARQNVSVHDTIEHLVGMQAQAPVCPYIGLWTRLVDFRPEELSEMIDDRRMVRIPLMRSTIHLVSARDCLAIRPLMQPVIERTHSGNHGKRLVGVDAGALARAGRALVEERPRTFNELGKVLQERWADHRPDDLASGVRAWVPLVQVPPRGLWGRGGAAAHVAAWLGRPLERDPTIDDLVLRYLGAFGPASVRDVQTWSGLARLREVVDLLRPRLRTFFAMSAAPSCSTCPTRHAPTRTRPRRRGCSPSTTMRCSRTPTAGGS